MRHLQFGGCSGLGLLLLSFMLSCNALHQQERNEVKPIANERADATAYWEVEARVLPARLYLSEYMTGFDFSLALYHTGYEDQNGTAYRDYILVRYRECDSSKVVAFENALCSSGAVVGMRVTKRYP
jgi:hypothetical protein